MPLSRIAALAAGLILVCVFLAPAEAQRGRLGGAAGKERFRDLTAQIREAIKTADYQTAEKLARQHMEMSARMFGESHAIYGGSLTLLGRVLFSRGQYPEAEALLRRGLHLVERRWGARDGRTSMSMINLGQVLAAQNSYSEAEALLRRAIEVPDLGKRSAALLALGELMKDLGRYAEAEALADQSLAAIDAAFSQRKGGKRAMALRLLAQSHDDQGRLAPAYGMASRVLALNKRTRGEEHPETARTLVFVGELLHKMQRDGEAVEALENARAIAEKSLGGSHPLMGSAHLQLALAQEALGKLDQAEANYRAAVKVARGAAIPLQLAQASRGYGRHLVQRGRLVEALPHYREAIGMLERVFAETRGQSEEVRQQFAGRFNAYHHELIELLVRLHEQDAGAGHDREALAVASLTQSRIFSELLRQADVNQFVKEDAFKRLYKQRAAAVDQLRALRRESSAFGLSERELGSEEDEDDDDAAAEARTGSQMDARAGNLLRQITDAKRKLAETEDALRRRYPRYAELTQPQPVTAAELQQRLLRPGEALLSYAALPRQLVVFAVTRERFAMVALPVGSAELAAKIRAVRAPGEKFAAAGSLAVLAELDPERLHELYRLLAAPVDPMLLQAKHVLVAGDGPLHTLPLEMLITRWGEAERRAFAAARAAGPVLAEYATLPYLGSRGRFSYLPSLTALASQRLYQKPAVAYRNDLVSFADPVFGDAAAGGARPGMTRLPETADEAKEIAKLLGGRSRVYLGDDAQESVAKSLDLRSTRYLHFATHGLLAGEFLSLQQTPQQGRLGQPALALTLVGDLRGEDGLLTMKEVIESLDINAELVVLSACNTAGENETGNGEGFAGLTRSFMYAGARALLVSHWSVESLSTQEFMTDVFRNMKRGRPVGEAVSEARRTMLAGKADGDRSRAHPYFWAPFVHVGD